MIDYVLANGNTRRGRERMEVGDKVESDHHSLVVMVITGRKEMRKKENRERRTGSGKWSQRIKEVYEKSMERVRVKEAGLQGMIGQREERIKVEMERSEEEGGERTKAKKRGIVGSGL